MQTPTFTPTTFDVDIWESRWKVVKTTMDHMLTTMEKRGETVRQKTLQSALTALKAFGESQISFFLTGFGPGARVFLEPSTQYPPDYALRITLDQIVHDMNVIVRAWEQRQSDSASPAMRKTLAQADILANNALTPAIQQGLLEPATVVTYFQKDTNVRIIPYAPVSFIGLPITCQTVKRDLLAIPHEVGHYVYRYGRVRSGKNEGSRFAAALTQRYGHQSSWRQAWMEEIFADVYGGLIGGPVMALGFEDILSGAPRADFIHDDGEHPVPALRLQIYQAVFAVLKMPEPLLKALDERSVAWQADHGKPTSFTAANGETIDLAQAQGEIKEMVESMLADELADLRKTEAWTGKANGKNGLAGLHKQFEELVEATSTDGPAKVADLQLADPQWLALQSPQNAWQGKSVKRKLGDTDLWGDLIKAAAKEQQNIILPPSVWMALLDGSGWATEGPGGGNAH